MANIITQCPSCQRTDLQVTKLQCEGCHTTFEGKFAIPELLKLSDDDLHFIIDFVKCSGSLKEMALQQQVSYPTLRNRLNQLIESLEHITKPALRSKEEIIKLLEEGKLTPKAAAALLKKL